LDDVTRSGVITEAITTYEEGFKETSHATEEPKSCNEVIIAVQDKGPCEQFNDSELSSQSKVEIVKPGLVTGGVQYFMDLGKM